MGMPVRSLLGQISGRELAEWMAFDQVEPIGGLRGDYQAALVAATMANGFRGGKGKRYRIDDFLLDFGGVRLQAASDESVVADEGASVAEDVDEAARGEQSPEEMTRLMRAALWGGMDASRETAAPGGDIQAE